MKIEKSDLQTEIHHLVVAAREGKEPRVAARLRLVYRLDVNEYQGLRRAQLLIDYIEDA